MCTFQHLQSCESLVHDTIPYQLMVLLEKFLQGLGMDYQGGFERFKIRVIPSNSCNSVLSVGDALTWFNSLCKSLGGTWWQCTGSWWSSNICRGCTSWHWGKAHSLNRFPWNPLSACCGWHLCLHHSHRWKSHVQSLASLHSPPASGLLSTGIHPDNRWVQMGVSGT